MNGIAKTLALAFIVTLGHLCNTMPAYAINISIAEVRGDVAFVKGSDAGRKQQIFWEGVYVTTAKGKGNFSFEGDLPATCEEGDCVGMLTIDGSPIAVPLAFPPGGQHSALELDHEISGAHGGDSVRAVGFVGDGLVVSGGADARLRNWPLDPSQLPSVRELDNIIYDIDVETNVFATGEGGWNGHAGSPTLRIWGASGSPLAETQVPIGFVYSVAVSPNKNWIAASGFYGDIVLYRYLISSLAPDILELQDITATKKKRTKALTFIAGNSFLASASTGGIHLWSFPPGCTIGDCQLDLLLTLSHSGSWHFPIASAPHSTTERIEMVSGTDSGTTKFWIIENLATAGQTVSVQSVDSGAVYALAWSPDGTKIVAAGDRRISVYDSNDGRVLFRNEDAHAGRVNDVAFSPDSTMIVSGGADGALKFWVFPTP